MPVYEYKCAKCGALFERFVRLFLGEKPKCPVCGSEETDKVPSTIFAAGSEESGSSSSDFDSSCGVRSFG